MEPLRSYEYNVLEQQEQTLNQGKMQAAFSNQANITLQTLLGSPMIKDYLAKSLDLGSISKEWEETFAQPAMDAWWKYNAPGIRSEFAGVPGGFYSTDRARGVGGMASQYMSQSVQPKLFSALQNARAMMPNAIGAVTNPLMALSGMQPNFGQSPMPTEEDNSNMGPLIGGLLGIGAAGLTGGVSQMFTPESMMMGQFGSMAGGLFA